MSECTNIDDKDYDTRFQACLSKLRPLMDFLTLEGCGSAYSDVTLIPHDHWVAARSALDELWAQLIDFDTTMRSFADTADINSAKDVVRMGSLWMTLVSLEKQVDDLVRTFGVLRIRTLLHRMVIPSLKKRAALLADESHFLKLHRGHTEDASLHESHLQRVSYSSSVCQLALKALRSTKIPHWKFDTDVSSYIDKQYTVMRLIHLLPDHEVDGLNVRVYDKCKSALALIKKEARDAMSDDSYHSQQRVAFALHLSYNGV